MVETMKKSAGKAVKKQEGKGILSVGSSPSQRSLRHGGTARARRPGEWARQELRFPN